MDVSVLNSSGLMIIVKYAVENCSDVVAGEPTAAGPSRRRKKNSFLIHVSNSVELVEAHVVQQGTDPIGRWFLQLFPAESQNQQRPWLPPKYLFFFYDA